MTDCIRHVLAVKGRHIHVVPPSTTVLAAIDRMNDEHIGALLVVDDDHRIVGIFTERDILRRVVGSKRDAAATRVDEVMSRDVVTIALDATVTSAMMLVTDRRCRHLPVIDGDDICGLVSAGDLTSWIVRDQQRTIDDLYDYIHRT